MSPNTDTPESLLRGHPSSLRASQKGSPGCPPPKAPQQGLSGPPPSTPGTPERLCSAQPSPPSSPHQSSRCPAPTGQVPALPAPAAAAAVGPVGLEAEQGCAEPVGHLPGEEQPAGRAVPVAQHGVQEGQQVSEPQRRAGVVQEVPAREAEPLPQRQRRARGLRGLRHCPARTRGDSDGTAAGRARQGMGGREGENGRGQGGIGREEGGDGRDRVGPPGTGDPPCPPGPLRRGREERGMSCAGGRREGVSAQLHQCWFRTHLRDSAAVPTLLPDT